MFDTLSGLLLSVRIARPRIWLESMYELTVLESISELMAGASQPSPSSACVPMSTVISPAQNISVTIPTIWFRKFSLGVIRI